MIPAKDGHQLCDRIGARKHRCRLHSVSRRAVLLGLLCVLTLPVGLTPLVLGNSGVAPAATLSAARVLANQAMTLVGSPTPAVSTPEPSATANRPMVLQPEDAGLADGADADTGRDDRNARPEEGAVAVTYAKPTTTPMSPGSVVLTGGFQPPNAQAPRNQVDFSEDPIIEAINITSEQARVITIAKNSTASIDLKVPIDRAEIADPLIADVVVVSPRRVLVVGIAYGSTQLILWIGQEQRVFNIAVELDLAMLRDLIKTVAPTSSVQLHSVNGTIVLRGSVSDAETADQITQLASLVQGGEVRNQMRIAGVQQTMLRVVVAEVNREALRQLGVNWAIGASDWSRDFFFANNIAGVNPTIFGSSGIANILTGQQLYGVAAVGNTTNVTFGFPRAEFQMFLNALRQNGLSRMLAEPNLVAISGQTASFLAGGEVPIPVQQSGSATGAITIEYHEFGILLSFTPTVVAGQIIRLHIMTEVSEAVPTQQIAGGFPVFTFTTRRVESTIECGNGQTFAIAGLLSEEIRATASKIPGLGDIPVLGALFSSTNYQKSNTELVVLVTPQLVEPLDPQQVPSPPGGQYTEPDDFDLFAMQELEGPPAEVDDSNGVPRERAPVNVRPGGESTRWSTSRLALRGPWGLAEFAETH